MVVFLLFKILNEQEVFASMVFGHGGIHTTALIQPKSLTISSKKCLLWSLVIVGSAQQP
jgi:hypothetical protein